MADDPYQDLPTRESLRWGVGRAIGAIRRQQGITQADLARRAGVSRASLILIESGRQDPRTETAAALLSCLGRRLAIVELGPE